MSALVDSNVLCECNCFECSVDRHSICRHVLKCIKRPPVLGVLPVEDDEQRLGWRTV